nr:DUF2889 domain-containing protein [uncultured Pseudomonas sp.]
MFDEASDSGRRLIHQRKVECQGFLRADGLWDIEGSLSDSKTHPVTLVEGRTVGPGQTYHGMSIRLTLDDDFVVHEVRVVMAHVPTSECRGAEAAYQQLLGERIGPGFSRRIKTLFGGVGGCVHLTELLLPIATTAFQTIPMARAMVAPRTAQDTEAFRDATGKLLNTCHALREDSPVAVFLKK